MNANLLSNKELEDYQNEDSFDFVIKAEAIRLFLEFNSTHLEKNKMLVLYGNWGTGKTSLMIHIHDKINREIYYPIFFHAWEHEKDENLPLSLCDCLTNAIQSDNELVKTFMEGAFLTLRSFTNGISFKSSGLLSGLGLDVEFSGEKFNEAFDKALESSRNVSFYKSNKRFKESFRAVEELILKKYNAQKILIFVDDLDRCEPENVLNLLTALKLFFTYGNQTIFFCGIDKDAVTRAVKTKYKDVVKSEEYMEKVFDVSFNMPKTYFLKKILAPHFFNFNIKTNHCFDSLDVIEDFFKSVNFDNPRHLKKILNKYEILKSFKTSKNVSSDFRSLIPDLIRQNEKGKLFESIYCLFVIILYEFFPIEFKIVENYEQKKIMYSEVLYATALKSNSNYTKSNAIENQRNYMYPNDIEVAPICNILNDSKYGGHPIGFSNLLYIFSHDTPSTLSPMFDDDLKKYSEFFIDDRISTAFCKFLIKHNEAVSKEGTESSYIIRNLFKMVKYLL